ncbi:tetratricopeptide repeat protein [Candidatus Uhrbacteria bacterium]|nr:tetratricopeptide repeat protein [Candidatus Uhrbacteria bacterium]
MAKKILLILIIIAAAGAGGAILYQKLRTKNQELKTYIERNVPAEYRARLETGIREMQERIGGDRDIKDLNLWIDLGGYHYILGNLAEARASFETALKLNQLNYVAWGNLGDTLAEMGDLAGAEAAYRKTLELTDLPLYYEKFALFLEQYFPQDKKRYENLLLAAVAATGQRPEFIARLAAFYEEEGRLLEAKSHLEVLIQVAEDNQTAKKDLQRVERKITEQANQ